MDFTTVLTIKQFLIIAAAFVVIGALASSLKVLLDTGSRLKAAIAFLTALLSVAHFFPATPGSKDLEEKVPPRPAGGFTRLQVLVAIVLACAIGGCAYVSATGQAIKTCAGRTVSAADWNDAKALADAALNLDRLSAFSQLGGLALKYGPAFVDCVVAELREEYAKLLEQKPGARVMSSEINPSARAFENADAWLQHR